MDPSDTQDERQPAEAETGRAAEDPAGGAAEDPAGGAARARTEEILRESEERFRTLADNIAQLAWMADPSGSVFWYNERWFEYTGTTFEQMEGWGWRAVHHPDHVERATERFRRSIESGEEWEDTFPLRRRDGAFRWFLSRALPIRDEHGEALRWFGTNTDITERMEIVTLVALTGWGHERDRDRTRAAGFDHHLIKPADLTRLRLLLAEAAAGHPLPAEGPAG